MRAFPFIIWFNERSGSTHLSSLLDSHPEVTCWRELFFRGEANATEDYFTRSGYVRVKDFLDRVYAAQRSPPDWKLLHEHPPTQRPMAIGFKLKYEQLHRYKGLRKYIIENRLAVIHIVRQNLLATLVSSKMVPELLNRLRTSIPRIDIALDDLDRSIALDPLDLVSQLDDLARRISWAKAVIVTLPVMEITYEDLVSRHNETCKRILTFLGIDREHSLSSKYQKIMPGSLRASIKNFDEIVGAL